MTSAQAGGGLSVKQNYANLSSFIQAMDLTSQTVLLMSARLSLEMRSLRQVNQMLSVSQLMVQCRHSKLTSNPRKVHRCSLSAGMCGNKVFHMQTLEHVLEGEIDNALLEHSLA